MVFYVLWFVYERRLAAHIAQTHLLKSLSVRRICFMQSGRTDRTFCRMIYELFGRFGCLKCISFSLCAPQSKTLYIYYSRVRWKRWVVLITQVESKAASTELWYWIDHPIGFRRQTISSTRNTGSTHTILRLYKPYYGCAFGWSGWTTKLRTVTPLQYRYRSFISGKMKSMKSCVYLCHIRLIG